MQVQRSPRPEIGRKQTPQRSGALTSTYEGKFGTKDVLSPDPQAYEKPFTPRGRPGLTNFTDPSNPFNRNLSKNIVSMDSSRGDLTRAGVRTRNPGVMIHSVALERAQSADGTKSAQVPFGYSNPGDYRPQRKAFGNGKQESPLQAVVASTSKAGTMSARGPPGKALANYLNDMKSTASSRRMQKDWGPSDVLQRMNDRKVKLTAERCDVSREKAPPERRTEPGCVPLSARGEDEKMFARKRRPSQTGTTFPAAGAASGTCSPRPLSSSMSWSPGSQCDTLGGSLDHAGLSMSKRREASLNRTQRTEQADARTEQLHNHMRHNSPGHKYNFEFIKARSVQGTGVFAGPEAAADTASVSEA
eukprot:TRINITY_DN15803_c0_g1_i2.p1 TRINITY_DN15803_c0_g1~~TRINITY_DN15803_c0_g1_i2.p1  ORF type:complete len:360 (-),score=46.10 TRINITY_DN15803_c0_g1_i2:107-1186(-)